MKSNEKSQEGSSSIYRWLQLFVRPDVCDLIDLQIEMVYNISNSNEEKELQWCQGEVVELLEKSKKWNKVRVLWDPLPNVAEFQDYTESDEERMSKLWNSAKTVEGLWRLDIDLIANDDRADDHAGNDSTADHDVVSIMDTNIDICGDTNWNNHLYLCESFHSGTKCTYSYVGIHNQNINWARKNVDIDGHLHHEGVQIQCCSQVDNYS